MKLINLGPILSLHTKNQLDSKNFYAWLTPELSNLMETYWTQRREIEKLNLWN